jgi:hypothetical protein
VTPLIRVVRGEADPAELAALTVVLLALTAHRQPESRRCATWTPRDSGYLPPGSWAAAQYW